MLTVQIVPVEYIHTVFEHVEEFIDNALQYANGDFTTDEVRVFISTGEWQLLIAADENNAIYGCAVVHYYNRPRERVAHIVAIGGKLISNKDTFTQLTDILRAHGAMCIEGAARESIARLWRRYGFTEKCRIVAFEL